MEPSPQQDIVASPSPSAVAVAPHRQLRYVVAVGVGGAVGVATRYLLTTIIAPTTGQPVVTLGINLLGSFLLGLLLEALVRCGPDAGRRRLIRLMIGTGGLGGFTTYSTLAVDVQGFLRAGQPLIMVGFGLGSVLLGVVAAAAGIVVGARLTTASRRAAHDRSGRA